MTHHFYYSPTAWKFVSTCDLRLACTRVDLRWLALTLVEIKFCTQVKASFSPFGHPTQVNASVVTSINLLLVSEIEDSLP